MEPAPHPVPANNAWSSPGTTVDAPRFRSTPTIFDSPAPPTNALAASPVSRLQPRTVGQLLDGGFEVLRFRFRTIAIVAATVVLPLYAIPQILISLAGGVTSRSAFGVSDNPMVDSGGQLSSSFRSTVGLGYLATLGLMIATMIMGVAVTHLVSAWLMGHDPTPAATLRFVRSRLPVTIGAFLLALLFKLLVGVPTCALGLVYLLPALSVLAPVIAVEQLGAAASISRSLRLTRRRLGPLLGISLLWFIASSVVSLATSAAAAAVGGALTSSERGAAAALQGANVVATVVLLVVQVSVTALAYVDLRVRTEGLDLELEMTERFR